MIIIDSLWVRICCLAPNRRRHTMDRIQPNARIVASHTPWNKGRLIGQKPPLKLKDIWALRVRLQLGKQLRNLALAYFTPCRPGISRHGGHPFHVMPATDFTACRPPPEGVRQGVAGQPAIIGSFALKETGDGTAEVVHAEDSRGIEAAI